MHSTHQPSPSQSVLVHSSLCNPPTGNPPLQSVRVCPTSASAPTVHCVSELVLSSFTPVNENHFCSPHNRQPDRNQCLWIPWCAFHYVLPFCSFCLLAITPPLAGHHRVSLSISAPVNKNHCAFHPSAITIAISACAFQSVHSTHRQSTVAICCNQCVCVQHPRQHPQFTVCQNLCFLVLHQ